MAPSIYGRLPSRPEAQAVNDWFAEQGAPTGSPGIDPQTGQPWQATDQEPDAWGQQGGGAPPAGGGDAAAIIARWQQTHAANEPLDGLIAELQRNGINAGAFVRGSIASGNEISLNGQQYKVKTGDNANWWDPSMGEGGEGGGGLGGYGGGGFLGLDPMAAYRLGHEGLTMDPGYQFRMEEGQKALERSAAAKGTLLTGGTMKGLARYAQDYASGEFQNRYNRLFGEQQNRYNQLYGVAGLGQASAAGQAAANSAYGQNAGNTITDIGNANAAGTVGGANASNQAIGGSINTAQQYYLARLWGTQPGGGGGTGTNYLPGATQPGMIPSSYVPYQPGMINPGIIR